MQQGRTYRPGLLPEESSMKIRGASYDDLEQLVKHGEEFWEHTRYSQVDGRPYDRDTVFRMCSGLITNDTGDILVLDDDGTIKGFVLLAYYPLAWDHNLRCAGELAWYLAPELRGGKLGVKLLAQAENLAKLRDCTYMAMISMSHSMDLGPLYEKLGYIETEKTYTKEL